MLANTTHPATQSTERLTWDQICERYPDEWVVLVETEWVNETDFEFGTARVIDHDKSRKALSPRIKAAYEQYDELGSFWTGEVLALPRFVYR